MNIGQILVLIAALSIVSIGSVRNFKERTDKYRSKIYYWFSCHLKGNCPTTKERGNESLKELARSLEGNSYKETLSNILEWQNRNIEFWTERHPILTVLLGIYQIFAVVISIFTIVFSISIFLLIMLNNQIMLWFINSAENFLQLSVVAMVSSTITTFAIMAFILHSNRKFSWKEVLDGIKNVISPSISMNFLLKNGLGICRDYAKLTACLLSNIYPNEKIYFAYAPGHVGTGISIKNKLYMLDQRLPILTIEKWSDYRKPKKSDKIERFDFTSNTLEKVDKKVFLRTKNKSKIDIKKLAIKMEKILNIKRSQNGDKTAEIERKKGVVLYEDDELVNYSLARYIKMEASNKLVDIDKVTGIEVKRHNNDLKFLIHFN
ncbi:MAG: transglutaminase-like domain-containing protein [Candidatus Aenigmatarchaeota archaeon]